MKIAFFGITGMLGKPVAKEMLKAGFELKALVRDLDKAKKIFPNGVEFVQGDIHERNKDAVSLAGCDVCYLSLSISYDAKEKSWNPEREGLIQILEEAKKAGIKRLSYLSSLIKDYQGFNWWVFEDKKKAVQILKDSGLPTTIFYPSAFMETLRDRQLINGKLNVAGKSLHKIHWIAGEDYGKMVVADFKLLGNEDRDWVVQGIDKKDQMEAAKDFVAHYPQKISIAHAPLGLLKFIGIFKQDLNFLSKIIEALNNMPEPFRGQAAWDKLHKPTITLQEFAKGK